MSSFDDNYRTIMDTVDFDDELRERVMRNARDAQQSAHPTAVRERTVSRRRFLGIGIAAAATIAAVGIAAANVPANIFGLLSGNENGAVVNDAHEGNWFSLKAYADEPDAPANEAHELDVEYLSLTVHQGGYSNGMSSAEYLFDFSITGTNIDSVTYEIDGGSIPSIVDLMYGDGATWEYVAFRQTIVVLDSEASRRAKEGSEQGCFSSFTVDYNDQDSHFGMREDPLRRTIYIRFRAPEEAAELFEAASAAADGSDEQLWLGTEANFVCACEAARRIGETPLSVTATFADGATQTKRYRIAPIEGFEDRFRAWFEHNDAIGTPGSSLFTITELSDE